MQSNTLTPSSKKKTQATAQATPFPPLPEIPRARYLDDTFYQAEIEHIFRKQWLAVAHVSDFADEGSYRLLDIPFAPVVVVRGVDGELRAFLNSCQHRAATVLKAREGRIKVMSCQYHGWVYDLEGKLIGLTSPESFPDLDYEEHSLTPLRCELWGGFVFVNFDLDAPPLLEWLAPLQSRYGDVVEQSKEKPIRVAKRLSWEVNCNWKAMAENFAESYHVEYIHPNTVTRMVDCSKPGDYTLYPNGHGTFLSYYIPKDEVTWEGSTVSGLPEMPGMAHPKYDVAAYSNQCFPNSFFNFLRSGHNLIQIWPRDVNHCRLDLTLFGVDWGDGPVPSEWDAIADGYEIVELEDISCMSSIQQSMQANPGRGVPFGSRERLLYQLHAHIDRLIGQENIDPKLRVPDIDALNDFIVA